jgi:type IV pilus assembly protein PilW
VARRTATGFSLIELLITSAMGLMLIAAFLVVLQRCRVLFAANESLAQLQDSARHALGLLASDIEHAGFFGFAPAERFQLVGNGAVLARHSEMRQPTPELAASPVSGLPAGAHDCGVNFAVDLHRPVQGTDNASGLFACAPTPTAGGARPLSDTLTMRHASLETTEPLAGRLQIYSATLASVQPVLLFADGRAPGARDDAHQVRDLEVRSYYVANNSVGRPGHPALRVKSLTESRGRAQFRDEEVMPGVEDLQVELGVPSADGTGGPVQFVTSDSPLARQRTIVAVRLWMRLRAETTELGFRDDRALTYSNTRFTPDDTERIQRRLLLVRTVALRNRP